jgi:hypothetical protein
MRDREKAANYQREYLKDPAHRAKHNEARVASYKRNPEGSRRYSLDYYRANRDRLNQAAKDRQLVTKYGITRSNFEALLLAQGGCCANPGCRTDKPGGRGRFAVDHDHATGARRGLLCVQCNTALGQVGDSVAKLEGLIAYLRQHGVT